MADIVVKGTAFSTDLASGDWYHRTDLKLSAGYDGTRWLDTSEHTVNLPAYTVSANGNAGYMRTRDSYSHKVNSINVTTSVATTNDSDNFWTVAMRVWDSTFANWQVIHSFTTSADAADTDIDHSTQSPSVTALPNYKAFYALNFTKTGSPGNITVYPSVDYRYILT